MALVSIIGRVQQRLKKKRDGSISNVYGRNGHPSLTHDVKRNVTWQRGMQMHVAVPNERRRKTILREEMPSQLSWAKS